jgi:hypothetical protein
MLQRKIGTEVQVYGAGKHKFVTPRSPSRKRLKFIKKIHMGSIGQYKRVVAGSKIKAFFHCHCVMPKNQKIKINMLPYMLQRKVVTDSTSI